MIKSYGDKKVEKFATTGKFKSMPNQINKRAMMRLVQLDNATCIEDLKVPPSNHLEKLIGNRKNQYSIRINQQYRLCFVFENGDAYNVEIIDYH